MDALRDTANYSLFFYQWPSAHDRPSPKRMQRREQGHKALKCPWPPPCDSTRSRRWSSMPRFTSISASTMNTRRLSSLSLFFGRNSRPIRTLLIVWNIGRVGKPYNPSTLASKTNSSRSNCNSLKIYMMNVSFCAAQRGNDMCN